MDAHVIASGSPSRTVPPGPVIRLAPAEGVCSALGRPGPRPLLLVHGWAQTAESTWHRVLPYLKGPLLAVDLPGHGMSRDLPGPATLDEAALAVVGLCRSLEVDDVAIVGHSLGGAVAARACMLEPDLFSSFTAVCSTLYWPDRLQRGLDRLCTPLALPAASPTTVSAYQRSLRLWWGGAPSPSVLRRELSWFSALDSVDWGSARLPRPRFLVASSDRVLPARWQHRSAALVSAETVEVRGGHGFFLDDPGPLLESLSDR